MDSFRHKAFLCLVTDYCDAGDLYQYLQTKKKYLPEERILDWFVQLCLAVQYIHERKILHRDLKSQNIFLTKQGDIVLGDFGIARVLKNNKREMASTVIGTPYYMSPEIMESKPYDFKSDLWALGCILFEASSLRNAFEAQDMNGLVMKIVRGRPRAMPGHYSAGLKALVTGLLSKNPSKRPPIAKILQMDFLQASVTKALAKCKEFAAGLVPDAPAARVPKAMRPGIQALQGQGPRVPNAKKVAGLNLRQRIESEIQRERAKKEAVQHRIDEVRYRREKRERQRREEKREMDHAVASAEERLLKIQRERDEVRRQAVLFQQQQIALRNEAPAARNGYRELAERELPHVRWEDVPGRGDGPHLRAAPPAESAPPPAAAEEGRERSAPLDPRAARAARKAEENRKYEEELQRIREENHGHRKVAEEKQKGMYQGSNHPGAYRPPPQQQPRWQQQPRRPPQPGVEHARQYMEAMRYQDDQKENRNVGEEADPDDDILEAKLAYLEMQAETIDAKIHNLTRQIEDEDLRARRLRDDIRDFEDGGEGARPAGKKDPLSGTIDVSVFEHGSVREKFAAIRSFCISNLGKDLFKALYKFMLMQSAPDANYAEIQQFGTYLRSVVGPARGHFFPLVDKLVHLEELEAS